MGFQTSLGVELTENRMILACLKTSLKGVKLAAHGVYPLESDRKPRELPGRISESIREFTRRKRINPTNIHLGISGKLAVLKEIEFPLAVKENLGRTLGYELDKYAPLPVEEIYHDYQILEEDPGANRLKLIFGIVRKKEIDPFADLGKSLGAGLSGVEIHSTALANFAVHCSPVKQRGVVAAIHLGTDVHDLVLFKGQQVRYARSLPPGGSAEDLLRTLAKIWKPSKKADDEESPRPGVLVLGPGAEPAALEEARAESEFDLIPLELADAGIPDWEIAPAFGLALKGLGQAPTRLNLLPPRFRKKPPRAGLYIMILLTLLVIASGLAWGGGRFMKQRALHNQLDARIERLESKARDVDAVAARVEDARKRLDYLNGLRGKRLDVLDLLRELTMLIPETAWVRDFTYTEDGVKLDGFADSAAELITILDASPNFTDVGFLSAITKGKDGMERFRIGLKVK
ncbi:MAG: pilus assembly protein PilM [Desulfobacterales bacterium]|nr:pilus assembly protein PilM [Desulfobacterales bacterium]